MKKTSFSANRVALAVAVICAGASVPAFAQVEAKVTGRVHFDARNISNGASVVADRDSTSYADSFEIRRARIGITGAINKDITYEVVGNAVGSSTNFVDTAFANYGFNKAAQFRAGRFKQPFSLEELTSSNSIDFMERSYGNQMVPGKRLGIMLHGEPMKGLNYGLSAFQADFTETSNSTNAGNNYAARVALNAADFAKMEDTVLHVGVAHTGGKSQVVPTSSGSTVAAPSATTRATVFSLRDENRGMSNIYRARVGGVTLHTGSYGGSSNDVANIEKSMSGLELALAKGPVKFQLEQFNSKFIALSNPGNTTNLKVKSDYMEVMYNITGEQFAKSYKSGAFSGLTPSSVFMKDYGGVVGNGIGAWQVGFRQSSYEVSDLVQTGTNNDNAGSAKGKTSTYGLNWYLNNNARVMFNYAKTTFNTAFVPVDTSGNTVNGETIISVRTQVNF
jgi:phosphate-selective porin OprO/OprP